MVELRRARMRRLLSLAAGVLVGLAGFGLLGRDGPPPRRPSAALLTETRSAWLGDAARWARRAVPLFECSERSVERAYYYRWRLFWLHLKRTPRHGHVISEFLPPVNWAGPHGTINCAFGHHAAEARWVRDPAVLDDYSLFWFRHAKADLRYTWWPAHSALERFRLDGRTTVLRQLYAPLAREYWRWANRSVAQSAHGEHPPCMWQAAHDDGQENSVGGDGCRPTINAAMYGEARALSQIGALLADRAAAAAFSAEAKRWRRALLSLWHPRLQAFVTRAKRPPPGRLQDVRLRRTKLGCLMCPAPRRGAPRCPPAWADGELVDVREMQGLTSPWYHRVAGPEHAVAFAQLRAPGGFGAPWGVRTAERRHACYNFTTDCVTSWHGPVWPFESAKLGTAMINALHGPHRARLAPHLAPSDFADFLRTYAQMHTRGAARDVEPGEPFVGESFHGDEGFWYTRELMYRRRHGDRRRGDHYFHSSYCDLVLSGLVGLHVRMAAGRATLVLSPLFAPGQISWFSAAAVRVLSHDVDVAYDADGSRYGGVGLAVWVDGTLVARRRTLGELTASMRWSAAQRPRWPVRDRV